MIKYIDLHDDQLHISPAECVEYQQTENVLTQVYLSHNELQCLRLVDIPPESRLHTGARVNFVLLTYSLTYIDLFCNALITRFKISTIPSIQLFYASDWYELHFTFLQCTHPQVRNMLENTILPGVLCIMIHYVYRFLHALITRFSLFKTTSFSVFCTSVSITFIHASMHSSPGTTNWESSQPTENALIPDFYCFMWN